MKKIADFLNPFFMQQIDGYLLLHNRFLWISKIHYVLFYGLLVAGFMAAFVGFYPTTTANLPSTGAFVSILSFVLMLPFLFWIYRQSFFSIEKEFGVKENLFEYKKIAVYLLAVFAFFAVPFMTYFMVEHKVKNVISDSELIADINQLNLYHSILNNVDNIDPSEYTTTTSFTPYLGWGMDKMYKIGLKDNGQIQTEIRTFNARKTLENDYVRLVRKYESNFNYVPSVFPYEAHQNINQIAQAKFDYLPQKSETIAFFSTIFLILFGFANLLWIFNLTTYKEFFSSAVFFVALALIDGFVTTIFSASFGGEQGVFFVLALGGFVFLALTASGILRSRFYSFNRTTALIMVVFATPFLLLWTGATYDIVVSYNFLNDGTALFILWAGIGVHLLLIPYFYKLFITLRSVPKS